MVNITVNLKVTVVVDFDVHSRFTFDRTALISAEHHGKL